MASIKTITDPVKGNYDLLVSDSNVAAGAVLPGDPAIVGGIVSASLGATSFLVSGSGHALTASLPAIDATVVGKSARIFADVAAIAVTASNGLGNTAAAYTVAISAYGVKEYVAVSGALGYYWHTVI